MPGSRPSSSDVSWFSRHPGGAVILMHALHPPPPLRQAMAEVQERRAQDAQRRGAAEGRQGLQGYQPPDWSGPPPKQVPWPGAPSVSRAGNGGGRRRVPMPSAAAGRWCGHVHTAHGASGAPAIDRPARITSPSSHRPAGPTRLAWKFYGTAPCWDRWTWLPRRSTPLAAHRTTMWCWITLPPRGEAAPGSGPACGALPPLHARLCVGSRGAEPCCGLRPAPGHPPLHEGKPSGD